MSHGTDLADLAGRTRRLIGPDPDLRTDDQLSVWVQAGTGYARALPAKPAERDVR